MSPRNFMTRVSLKWKAICCCRGSVRLGSAQHQLIQTKTGRAESQTVARRLSDLEARGCSRLAFLGRAHTNTPLLERGCSGPLCHRLTHGSHQSGGGLSLNITKCGTSNVCI